MLGFETVDDGEIFHTVKFIEDVPLIMTVEIGRTEMEVQKVLNLKKGSMLVFEKIVGEPMDVVVGNRLMARGEIVVVKTRRTRIGVSSRWGDCTKRKPFTQS